MNRHHGDITVVHRGTTYDASNYAILRAHCHRMGSFPDWTQGEVSRAFADNAPPDTYRRDGDTHLLARDLPWAAQMELLDYAVRLQFLKPSPLLNSPSTTRR